MKKALLFLMLLSGSLAGFAQAPRCSGETPRHYKKSVIIHGQNTFLINQSSFSHWAAGGADAIALNVVLDYDFDYKKDKWSWDNKAIVGYGLAKQNEGGWQKNDDRIILNSLLGYKAAQYWLYTFYANFQTQFTNGYNYTANGKTLISAPFAPAYLTFGPGFAYKKSDNFRVNISPFAAPLP